MTDRSRQFDTSAWQSRVFIPLKHLATHTTGTPLPAVCLGSLVGVCVVNVSHRVCLSLISPRWGLNPRPIAYKAIALPLSYGGEVVCVGNTDGKGLDDG